MSDDPEGSCRHRCFRFRDGRAEASAPVRLVARRVRDPESIAEHSLRVAQLAGLIAAAEGGDPAKAAYMGLWHDSQETRIGDIPHSARPYVQATGNVAITVDQVAGMAEPLANSVIGAVEEYEAKESLEAICARDADKLECLIQAVEYRDLGVQRVPVGLIHQERR